MLNNPTLSLARQPRGLIQVSGRDAKGNTMPATKIAGWMNFEVNNNVFYEADTFRITFSISGLPIANNEAWWASQKEIFVELFAGFPSNPEVYGANDLQSLTYGRVDDITYNPVARTLEVSGRDLTAAMIDTKTTEKFQNLTASQIAINVANRHGLTPVVTATKLKVGKYYQLDQNKMNVQRSEWDLLTGLAQEESFNVYVKGKTLHFEPQPLPNVNPYVLRFIAPTANSNAYALNAISLNFSRALNLARGVVVIVNSHSMKTGKNISVKFPSKSITIRPGESAPTAQVYAYKFASMDYEKALKKAQQIHADITQHEVKLSAELPADTILSVANLIQVIGTNTSFDQNYYPESITREMSMESGYKMQITAKNNSPQSIVPL